MANPFVDIPLSFDVTQDIPIEVLHTILLGIVKYFVKEMSKFIKPKKGSKDNMTTIGKMVQENHSALPPPPGHRVAVRQFIRYSGSFVGKDFRYTIQRALALLGATDRRFEASTQNLILLGWATAWVSKIVYSQRVDRARLNDHADLVSGWVKAYHYIVEKNYPHMLKKVKLHLLNHLPHMIRRFGLLGVFSSEAGERMNGTVRVAICQTNRHNSSQDVAKQFVRKMVVRGLLDGAVFNGYPVGHDFMALTENKVFKEKVLGTMPEKRWSLGEGVTVLVNERVELGIIQGFNVDATISVHLLRLVDEDMVWDQYVSSNNCITVAQQSLLSRIDLIASTSPTGWRRNKLFWDDFRIVEEGRAALERFWDVVRVAS